MTAVLTKRNTTSADVSLQALKAELRAEANPAKARILSSFFKTGKGQYGEGDRFLGLTVPQLRSLAGKYRSLGLKGASTLLRSPYHEERLTALLILVELYECGSAQEREAIYRFYARNTAFVNNWDLVDLSAPKIVGRHFETKSRKPLFKLAVSSNLWERRIAVVACLHFIRRHDFADFLKIAGLCLGDEQDLMHKASGWMLREAGKRNLKVLRTFLDCHHKTMPRTMLRYAIERLPQSERRAYMAK